MRRSKHGLSHWRLASLNQGVLYPVGLVEALPGDTFRHASACLLRVSPLATPVMHPVHVRLHHWFVPSRILWEGWEQFITGQDTATPLPSISVSSADTSAIPLVRALGVGFGSQTLTLNALPFRAYNKIFNEFYRDQDLVTALTEATGDSDSVNNYSLVNVAWEKDYFTVARPYAQQGADTSAVDLTLSGEVPITGIGKADQTWSTGAQTVYETLGTASSTYSRFRKVDGSAVDTTIYLEEDPSNLGFPNIKADLSGISGLSLDMNEWRQAMAYQRIREHRNKFGHRYRDMLAFLGVRSSDARLQRPEYLGGGKQTIAFSEVLGTADVGNSDVGSLAGHGIAALRTRPYKRFFEEHGYVVSLMSVLPRTIYMNSTPRTFTRQEYTDFWQKELEMMGEQEIRNVEVYTDATAASGTFGYGGRFDEYRFQPSGVSGEFLSTLNDWHMGRSFTSQPVLNSSFVTADPTDRIYQSTASDELYGMVSHRLVARRLVSKRSRS